MGERDRKGERNGEREMERERAASLRPQHTHAGRKTEKEREREREGGRECRPRRSMALSATASRFNTPRV
jgi:hypothetical protein